VGRWSTILGVLISIGAAYFVTQFKSIMDYMQALSSFFFAPLFGTVLLGMLWKRGTRKGGFWGLLAGSTSSVAMFTMVKLDPSKLAWIALSPHAKDMAENLYRALWSFLICCAVTIIVSLCTQPKTAEELQGLVRGYTDIPSESDMSFYKRPLFWGIVLGVLFAILQWIFW
jgi:SSS family solute:Na+ symporter